MTTQHLESVGHLAHSLSVSVAQVKRTALELGVSPAVTINAVDHFDAAGAERIADALAAKRSEVQE